MLNFPFYLHNKVALVSGLANLDSIAFGCAQALLQAGARVIVTYMPGADQYIMPLKEELGDGCSRFYKHLRLKYISPFTRAKNPTSNDSHGVMLKYEQKK